MGSRRCLLLLLLLLLSVVVSAAASSQTVLRILPGVEASGHSSSREDTGDGADLFCESWRLSVETNDAGSWRVVPDICLEFVEQYMSGGRYVSDSDVIAVESLAFAETVGIAGDGKDVWVFDVDETLLSNLPYYAVNGYGTRLFNETSFDEWVYSAKALALPASLRLYKELQGLGFQMVLLTGRGEAQRNVTKENLLFAGYRSWERLILRGTSDIGKHAVVYKAEKRAELEAQGYRIHGNSGDQWSDLLGSPMAKQSFKVPNPMYYIG